MHCTAKGLYYMMALTDIRTCSNDKTIDIQYDAYVIVAKSYIQDFLLYMTLSAHLRSNLKTNPFAGCFCGTLELYSLLLERVCQVSLQLLLQLFLF